METLVRETTTTASAIRSEQASTTALSNAVSFGFALIAVFVAAITMTFIGIATSSMVILGSGAIIATFASFVAVFGTLNMIR